MLKTGAKFIVILTFVFSLSRCIDPYVPKLNGYESLLVVEGLVTDANSSYTVKLSRSVGELDTSPEVISDARVYINDEVDNTIFLKSSGDGRYKTDSLHFRGVIGNTYVLHIETSEGDYYESEPYKMEPVAEIDNIYYRKDMNPGENGTVMNEGLRIFLDSKGGSSNKFYRWDFEETWKFKIPTPKKFDYVNETTIVEVMDVKEYCYKQSKSSEILIYSAYERYSDHVENQPVFFIDPKKSDRLMLQYSILVKQYSISSREYEFWNNMKKINEKGGDIFALQPFPVVSNVHNINNSSERVLGYFQVSAVKEKRIFISFSDLVGMNLPFYKYPCKRIEMAPEDYPSSGFGPPMTWDQLYDMYCKTSLFYFVEPKYVPGTTTLQKLVFTTPECANCELTGTRETRFLGRFQMKIIGFINRKYQNHILLNNLFYHQISSI